MRPRQHGPRRARLDPTRRQQAQYLRRLGRILTHARGARPQKGKDQAIAEWPTDKGPADYVLFAGLLFQPLSRNLLGAYQFSSERIHYYYDFFLSKELYKEHPQLLVLSAIDLLEPWALELLDVPARPSWQRRPLRWSAHVLCFVMRMFVPPHEPVNFK